MLQNMLFNLAQRTLNPDVRRRVEGTLVTTALVLFGLHLARLYKSAQGVKSTLRLKRQLLAQMAKQNT